MYYPCSENKDADQLRGYREADLRLCFRPCKLLVFSRTGSIKCSKIDIFTFFFFSSILKLAAAVLVNVGECPSKYYIKQRTSLVNL